MTEERVATEGKTRLEASLMDQKMTALERAFQLASSGRVAAVSEIGPALRREGYFADQIEGRHLRRQLADLIKAARKASADPSRT